MSLTRRSSLRDVAECVATALSQAGIPSVLTGGACATLYTAGTYQSEDLDFVLQAPVPRAKLEAAMRSAGFRRRGDQYFHPRAPFFVEFPTGPLGIGGDLQIHPVEYRVRSARVLTLSPTDSCRDRLAAFYHWSDRQSLEVAVEIARRHPVNLQKIRRWSEAEGSSSQFKEFEAELKRARRARRLPARKKG